MSAERENPLNVSILGQLTGKDIDDQISELWDRIRSANDARSQFIDKQERLLRQRRGIRKPKSFPWPGANNHSWPLIDAVARRWKPGICSLVLQAEPVCYFFGRNPEAAAAAPVAQEYYHWRFHQMEGVPETVMELAEYIFQYGIGYTVQGWDYQTEKQCRIVRVRDLFPGGLEAAVQERNAQVEQMTMQVQAAVAAGQADPAVLQQIPGKVDGPSLLQETFEKEYLLKPDVPIEMAQIRAAIDAVMKGAEVVKFYYQVVKSDKLAWRAWDPLRVTVPPRCADVPNADYVAFEHFYSTDDVARAVADGHFYADAGARVIESMKKNAVGDPERNQGAGSFAIQGRQSITDLLDKTEGIATGTIEEPNTESIFEIYCKIDINNDGIKERCRLWYHPGINSYGDKRGCVLALYELPYPFAEWPVVRFEFEHTSKRPYASRGAAELLSVFQAQVNKLHNARLDAIQIVLSPMLVMRTTAGDENRNIKFMPGAIIPVQAVGDVAPLQMDASPLQSLLQEENVTKNLAEQYVGVFDPGILAENAVERRTATEVDAVQQQVQSVFGQDAAMFQAAMRRVHKQLWDLEEEFGPDEVFYRVMGDPKPRLCRKVDIAYDYDIQPAGTPANTNQAFARKKALEAIQLFGADLTGLIDKHALFKHYFEVTDRNLGKVLVRPPEQAALLQQMQQAVAQMGQKPMPPP